MNWKEWFKYYFLNIDAVIAMCIFAAVAYFLITQKRKKCKFMGLNGGDLSKSKKKKKTKNTGRKRANGGAKLNKHEEECRRIFQELYGKKFKSVRPEWLRNPVTGKNLELDGFCPEIETQKGTGLAFEYDGEQHSKFNSHFHRGGPNEFVYQVKKDNWKDMKCKERGVTLIRIPHFVAYTDLRRYIIHELERQKVNIPVMNRGMFSGNMYN
jgi:hypothetical protein